MYPSVTGGSLPKASLASVQLLESSGLGEQTSQDCDVLNEACIKPGCGGIHSCPTPFLGMAAGTLEGQERQSGVSGLSS